MNSPLSLRLCLAVAALGLLRPALLEAAVVTVPLAERYYMGHRPADVLTTFHYFDLNDDGAVDVFFGNGGQSLTAATSGTNAIIHRLAAPPNHGGDAVPMFPGALIGVDPAFNGPGLIWAEGNSQMGTCVDTGCAGSFININAAVGVRFAAADGIHYGYMTFVSNPDTGTGWITGWAYDSTPDTAITVQPIPEPTAAVLASFACAALLSRRPGAIRTSPTL